MLDEAKRALVEGDYVRALDVAIKTGEEFNHVREVYEEATDVAKRAKRLQEVAVSLQLDTTAIDTPLEKAQSAMEGGRAEAARDAYQKALDAALGSVRSAVEVRLSKGRELAEKGKKLGVDVGVPLKKFSEAKALLDAEDYDGAATLIAEGVEAGTSLVTRSVEDAIAAAQSNIEHSRKLGADVAKAGELLGKARQALRDGGYAEAVELAQQTHGMIQIDLDSEKRFADRSFQAESTIRRAKRFGVDVLDAERLLAQAIQTKKQDPDKAMGLAEEAFTVANRAIESFSPSVKATLDVKDPVAGEWAEGTLTITNAAKALAKDVRVKILGDAEVEGLKDVPAVKARGSEAIPLKVKMMAAGSIPLAIQITSVRILDGKEYSQETIATIEVAEASAAPVAPAAPAAPEPKIQASAESRCPVCKGLIKVGFTIKQCPHCQRDMHELCATRSAKCPACGEPMAAEGAKRKKISFKVG